MSLKFLLFIDKNKEFFLPKTAYVDEDKLIVLQNLDKQIQTLCQGTFSSLHQNLLDFYKGAKKNWDEAITELNKINKEKGMEKTR
jgi:transcription elongation factor GreA-like protein